MTGPAAVGWCPGALRPMESGDGLILRVKPRGGRLTLDQASIIAESALRFGNGHLDLTGRANLQIRGVRSETLGALTGALRQAGLLDAEAAVEALRNIAASPLAGLDPTSFDTRPFLTALETCLAAGAEWPGSPLQSLPAKWSFVVDGGGRLSLTDVPADMRFRFDRTGSMRIGLDKVWSGPVGADFSLAALLADVAALVRAQAEPVRMAALLERLGTETLFADLGLPRGQSPDPEPVPPHLSEVFAKADGVLAFAPPFGGLPAEAFASAVETCRTVGGTDLRLTPWRVVLATGVADRDTLTAHLARLGFIVAADDPRLRVSTCVGAPACHRASTPTRGDAAMIAEHHGLSIDSPIHVAGCAKACARPPAARWTMRAHDGRYDVLHRAEAQPRVTGLSSTEAANWISRAERARIV